MGGHIHKKILQIVVSQVRVGTREGNPFNSGLMGPKVRSFDQKKLCKKSHQIVMNLSVS